MILVEFKKSTAFQNNSQNVLGDHDENNMDLKDFKSVKSN